MHGWHEHIDFVNRCGPVYLSFTLRESYTLDAQERISEIAGKGTNRDHGVSQRPHCNPLVPSRKLHQIIHVEVK